MSDYSRDCFSPLEETEEEKKIKELEQKCERLFVLAEAYDKGDTDWKAVRRQIYFIKDALKEPEGEKQDMGSYNYAKTFVWAVIGVHKRSTNEH